MNQRVTDLLSAAILLGYAFFQIAGLLLFAGMFLGMGGLVALIGYSEEDLKALVFGSLFGGMGVLLGIFLFATALPALVAGVAMLFQRDWARVLGLVAAALALPTMPHGTVVGIAVGGLILAGWQRPPRG